MKSTMTWWSLTALVMPAAAGAQDDTAALAQQLSNPVASLISVPLQLNPDVNIGPDEAGERVTLNVQPVIPVSLDEKWNLIARIITPLVYVDDIFPGSGSEFGLGDITPTAFFSPKAPAKGGLIWGAGPVLLLPTATDDLLGAGKWGIGPSALALEQSGHWTYGALVNHIWSVAGDDDRPDVSSTFLQPFLAKQYPSALTLTFNFEATYNWEAEDGEEWTVPLNVILSQVTKWGNRPISLGAGLRGYLEKPEDGPDWGVRLVLTLLYPKKPPA